MENREDRRREVCKVRYLKVRIWMYGKAISCWGRYLYIEREKKRERERERERDKRETRERQERAKSLQLMQGRAKLATLGREVSILKSHARTRFEKETGKGDICFSRKEVPTSPIISDIRPYTRAVGSSRPANSGKARHLFIGCPAGDGVHEPHHHHQLDRGN